MWAFILVAIPIVYVLSSGPVLASAFWLREATGWDAFYAVMYLYIPLFYLGHDSPIGAYIESEVTARGHKGAMRYVLVKMPKPAGSEVLPDDDRRFQQKSTAHVLREDRTAAVLFHHEATPRTLVDRYILHAELGGRYVVPPATVELMYQTEKRGHSGMFHFTVGGS